MEEVFHQELETTLESKSFKSLMDFLAFLVQKLWLKNNKLINCLTKGLEMTTDTPGLTQFK